MFFFLITILIPILFVALLFCVCVCVGGAKVLDPCMRRSTEFPQWVKDHHDELKDKKVLMYFTAGVRCERASSFLKHQGIDDVYQLDGGIHR